MEQPDHPPVAAAVIVEHGRVLLIRRTIPEGDLVWQFPAGAVEPGETLEHAAAREALEETGLEVAPTRTLGERIHPATGRRIAYVACEPTGGTARAAAELEVAEVRWCTLAEADELAPGMFPPVREYLVSRSVT